MLKRDLKEKFDKTIKRGKSILLLGPRQTGKTTLISEYVADLEITLLISKIRRQYEADPDQLIREVKALNHKENKIPLIIIDEVQKVPSLMDGIQYLVDKKLGQFILTGSSARKLKHTKDINLLPGRLIQLRLDTLTIPELEKTLPNIESFLLYGSLPAVCLEENDSFREEDLDSYVELYLEEEVRAEALVRNIGSFQNFLQLAATESGNIINFDKISQDLGMARSTITSYYQILEDCLIVERIEPFTNTHSRKKLIKSPKYLFFDLGVRRLAAQEQTGFSQKYFGLLFEQFIGLELKKWCRLHNSKVSLFFWRDSNGPEVDWLLKWDDHLLPIEVKWTTNPSVRDAKHLSLFKSNHPQVKHSLVICRCSNPQLLASDIEAISWKDLHEKLTSLIQS